MKASFGSTEHLPCWSHEKNNIRFGFPMYKTQILTPMLIYFRPLSFFTPRGALTGPRGGESAGSPPGLLNIPTNCILTKDGTFCRMRSLPHIFVAMALHYFKKIWLHNLEIFASLKALNFQISSIMTKKSQKIIRHDKKKSKNLFKNVFFTLTFLGISFHSEPNGPPF